MKVYTYSQARQQLASLLEEASRKVVKIRRRDGTVFELARAEERESGLDVPGLATDIGTAEMLSIVRESRAGTIAARVPARPGRPVRARRRSKQMARRGARSG